MEEITELKEVLFQKDLNSSSIEWQKLLQKKLNAFRWCADEKCVEKKSEREAAVSD